MKIVALDLGKFNSVSCEYDTDSGRHSFGKISTTPQVIHDLVVDLQPDRLVIEVGIQAGWIRDLAQALEVDLEVANTNDERWHWHRVKVKTDKADALKLAKLSAAGELVTIDIPDTSVRQWRSLIRFRQQLVRRRVACQNHIRSLFSTQGLSLPMGRRAWRQQSLPQIKKQAKPLIRCTDDQIWRGELHEELRSYEHTVSQLQKVERRLDRLARQDERVQLVQTIPGVGPRLSEAIVTVIDEPQRFKSGKQVGSYVGLTPRIKQSGRQMRLGRISKSGNPLLRTLLVEVGWLSQQYNPHFKAFYERIRRGSKTRKKIAATALARHILIVAWAMLRDHRPWREPEMVA